MMLLYDITMNCNLRCSHCYNSDFLKLGNKVEIDVEYVFNNILKLNPTEIVIQGGEPLLVENLEILIKKLRQNRVKVFITTNGMFLTKDRIVSLIKSGINGIYISMESACEQINDNIRGKGTFNIVYNNIYLLNKIVSQLYRKNLIYNIKLTICFTLSPLNIKKLEDINQIFYICNKLKIDNIKFHFLINEGNSKSLNQDNYLSDILIAERIAEVSLNYPSIKINLPHKKLLFEYLFLKYGNNLNIYGAKSTCPAGEKLFYLNDKLECFPCAYSNFFEKTKTFIAENKILLSSKNNVLLESEFLDFKKSKELEEINIICSNCKYRNDCIQVCPYDKFLKKIPFDNKMCIELKKKISILVEDKINENINISIDRRL